MIPSDLRKELGIEEGTRISVYREKNHLVLQPITDEFIHSLVGCLKGEDSLVAAWEREHRIEKDPYTVTGTYVLDANAVLDLIEDRPGIRQGGKTTQIGPAETKFPFSSLSSIGVRFSICCGRGEARTRRDRRWRTCHAFHSRSSLSIFTRLFKRENSRQCTRFLMWTA